MFKVWKIVRSAERTIWECFFWGEGARKKNIFNGHLQQYLSGALLQHSQCFVKGHFFPRVLLFSENGLSTHFFTTHKSPFSLFHLLAWGAFRIFIAHWVISYAPPSSPSLLSRKVKTFESKKEQEGGEKQFCYSRALSQYSHNVSFLVSMPLPPPPRKKTYFWRINRNPQLELR